MKYTKKRAEAFDRNYWEAEKKPNPKGRKVKIHSKLIDRVVEGVEKLPSGKEVIRVYFAGTHETYALFKGEKPKYI